MYEKFEGYDSQNRMNLPKTHLLEKYIRGTLNSAEEDAFMNLLLTDEEFKREVDFAKDLRLVAEIEDDERFRSLLKGFEREIETRVPKARIVFPYKRWAVAATITILIGLGVFLVQVQNFQSPEVLFTEYFEPYRNVVHPITRSEETPDLKTKAFLAYESKDYGMAISLFDTLDQQEANSYYLFYTANALLGYGKPEEAIVLLQSLSENSTFEEQSNWYLALAHLKLANTEKSKKILEGIVRAKSFNHEAAAKLLETLD